MGQRQDPRHEGDDTGLGRRNSRRGTDLRGQDSVKEEGWIEDQKPCGRREGHVSIFRGVRRILSAGQETNHSGPRAAGRA